MRLTPAIENIARHNRAVGPVFDLGTVKSVAAAPITDRIIAKAVGEHVAVVVLPLAGRTRGGCSIEDHGSCLFDGAT
jgi:hypothetical protein